MFVYLEIHSTENNPIIQLEKLLIYKVIDTITFFKNPLPLLKLEFMTL